jgi:hypothetical protein
VCVRALLVCVRVLVGACLLLSLLLSSHVTLTAYIATDYLQHRLPECGSHGQGAFTLMTICDLRVVQHKSYDNRTRMSMLASTFLRGWSALR